jgi:hypothetical protein
VNGQLSGSKTDGMVNVANTNTNRLYNFIGKATTTNGQTTNGVVGNVVLDEIKIFKKVLSKAQIQRDMNTAGGIAAGLC